ncbi:MAG: DNA-directed RNA polymerase subunit alpha [Deltaproteobacteria bacterium]|nr:MAG: DNA-directed RNA polymerase subunit alpha [Deltaproteobacteria bacterium]
MEETVYANWRSLIKPRRVERDSKSNATYGKFVIRPLERGFGTTIGNSLRRILLSSLQGAAVTSVKIDGVLHEFSSIPGVVEDVTDIILNIKGILLRTSSTEVVHATISAEGERGKITVVRAGQLTFDGDCEVLNPDHPIATLTEEGRFHAELTVAMGKGYVPAGENKDESAPIGTIPVDAIFSPIKRVRYLVTNARVGQRTDYDKLTLEIWTDGSVVPEDALAFSAKILKEQLQVFINFAEEEEPEVEEDDAEEEEFNENLFKRVDELELSVRSQNCLQNAGIEYIYQLVEKSEAEMLKTKNFGRKSLNEIKDILSDLGLALGMKLHNFPKHKVG